MDHSQYTRYIGIDLGGARGKSTAVALLRRAPEGPCVESVLMRAEDNRPWSDDTLLAYVEGFSPEDSVLAVNAPLTAPACVRCSLEVCPGYASCAEPATVWLRTIGQDLQARAVLADRDRIAAVPQGSGFRDPARLPAAAQQRIPPYTHRCTEVLLHFERELLSREHLGQNSWAIASRAAHLRRALAGQGFLLNESLLEVSPRCTVHALFGEQPARGYKRDADPWQTRAAIVEGMDDLSFAASSRLSREDVLRNDNCFDALLSAYTAYLWARDEWTMPEEGPFDLDGWIWAPPSK